MHIVRSGAIALLLLTAGPAFAQQAVPATPGIFEAPNLYTQHCASCHDRPGATRAPGLDALKQRTPEAILAALTTGAMSVQGGALVDRQRRALAVFLAGRSFGGAVAAAASSMPNQCGQTKAGNLLAAPLYNGWGNSVTNARYQPAPGFTVDQIPGLTLKWAFGLPNAVSAYAQPAVAGGRVYVAADTGMVYALDAASGCVYWSYDGRAGVRTALTVAAHKGGGARYAVYFGDVNANVQAVDAETGRGLWTTRIESHALARITGSPTLHEGRLYVPVASIEEAAGVQPKYECCTFRGSVVALDAANGKVIWKAYTIPREPAPTRKTSVGTQLYGPSGAGIWSAPTVDARRGLLYVATGDAYSPPAEDSSDAIIAYDLKTGRRRWSRQLTADDVYIVGCDVQAAPSATPRPENCEATVGPDFDFGSSAILATLPNGRTILTAGQKSGIAWGLDPDNGNILWQQRVGKGEVAGGVVFGPAVDSERGYFATNDQFQGRNAGGLSAVNLADGSLVWTSKPPCVEGRPCQPAQPGAVTVVPGAVFSGTAGGTMRAYSTVDGKVLWEFDTAREFPTVNKVAAKGGSLNGPGAVPAGGMVFVVSGYSWVGGGAGAGNVLLAFAPQP